MEAPLGQTSVEAHVDRGGYLEFASSGYIQPDTWTRPGVDPWSGTVSVTPWAAGTRIECGPAVPVGRAGSCDIPTATCSAHHNLLSLCLPLHISMIFTIVPRVCVSFGFAAIPRAALTRAYLEKNPRRAGTSRA